MTNPALRAFNIGRALAEVISEQVEDAVTTALSEAGKFDAEQRERLRAFSAEVLARAERLDGPPPGASSAPPATSTTPAPAAGSRPATPPRAAAAPRPTAPADPADIQAAIDDLRASIASARAELNAYRASQTSHRSS